ncbi:MAG TPA: hypothetical protein VG328_05625 [Stellaceae bacterium]|nr:hypothetical protein [Stellaceae bacterium]
MTLANPTIGSLTAIAFEARDEALTACQNWPQWASAHEGYGVLTEEYRELETHVFTKQKNRDLAAMRKEAIQLAAMAIRFVHDICDGDRGRK